MPFQKGWAMSQVAIITPVSSRIATAFTLADSYTTPVHN